MADSGVSLRRREETEISLAKIAKIAKEEGRVPLGYARRSRRRGVVPSMPRIDLQKWLWSAKPALCAALAML